MAQLAHEPPSAGAAAGQMFRDLSRLHHTGEIRAFLERWGHRSRNDYELSAPRFNEAPEETRAWAARFADLPWDDRTAVHSFTELKEAAKDRAIRCLSVLRRDALHLAEALGIPPRFMFALSLEDLEALSGGTVDGRSVAALAEQRHAEEQAWSAIDLGDQVSIETVERLEPAGSRRGGLRGRMVGAPVAFEGVARFEGSGAGSGGSVSEVLVTSFLKPELVARFPRCSGCITEVGGTLSHAAIVAREMGFPVLVLPGSTTTLRDGDRIEVRADGTIRLERVTS
jgi:pyruvate,water dikinase